MPGVQSDRPEASSTAKWHRLREIIRERSFRQGSFKLASGRTSPFFFDLKKTMLDPEGIDLLSDLVLERTAGIAAQYIGGLVMGAVPIVIGAVLKSRTTSRPLQGFWVRKEQKDHGVMNLADGYVVDGSSVIIVDDVATTGGSAMQAVKELRRRDCKIAAVLAIVDREEGAKANLDKEGLHLIALYKTSDFL
ncbi:MAG: orotate phosphoribosyltransferase [Alphaproteobacteria bacterium]|nr:orotate phosphoribosyltransferase [Alphaproteobacteria bacterium]